MLILDEVLSGRATAAVNATACRRWRLAAILLSTGLMMSCTAPPCSESTPGLVLQAGSLPLGHPRKIPMGAWSSQDETCEFASDHVIARVPGAVRCCAIESGCPGRELCVEGQWTATPARLVSVSAPSGTDVEVVVESLVDASIVLAVSIECPLNSGVGEELALAARERRTFALPIIAERECAVVVYWQGREISRELVNRAEADGGNPDAGLYVRLVALETLDAGTVVTPQQHASRRYLFLRNEDTTRANSATHISLNTECRELSAELVVPRLEPGAVGLARIEIASTATFPDFCRVWGTEQDTSVSFFLFHLSRTIPPVALSYPHTVACGLGSVTIRNDDALPDVVGFLDTPVVVPEDSGVRLLDDWVEQQLPNSQSTTLRFECEPGAAPARIEINSRLPGIRIEVVP